MGIEYTPENVERAQRVISGYDDEIKDLEIIEAYLDEELTSVRNQIWRKEAARAPYIMWLNESRVPESAIRTVPDLIAARAEGLGSGPSA